MDRGQSLLSPRASVVRGVLLTGAFLMHSYEGTAASDEFHLLQHLLSSETSEEDPDDIWKSSLHISRNLILFIFLQ